MDMILIEGLLLGIISVTLLAEFAVFLVWLGSRFAERYIQKKEF